MYFSSKYHFLFFFLLNLEIRRKFPLPFHFNKIIHCPYLYPIFHPKRLFPSNQTLFTFQLVMLKGQVNDAHSNKLDPTRTHFSEIPIPTPTTFPTQLPGKFKKREQQGLFNKIKG